MTYEQRAARLARARFWIRVELAIAALAVLGVGYMVLTGRRGIGSTFYGPPSFEVGLLPLAIGIGGVVLGFVWMVWLARQNPERGERTWRYSLAGRRRLHISVDAAITLLALAASAYLVITQTELLEWLNTGSTLRWLVPVVGIAGLVIAFFWLTSITSDPEGGDPTWRHRG